MVYSTPHRLKHINFKRYFRVYLQIIGKIRAGCSKIIVASLLNFMAKPDYSKKIIRILGEKPAISLPELKEKLTTTPNPLLNKEGGSYAITRSLKGLREAGLIESHSSGQNEYARLTKMGRVKASSQKLDASSSLLNPVWDGFWRMIILDIPEERKNERESLRYLLKKAGFICLKNSVWVSPHPFEHLFINIKKDLGLTTEMMIFVTDKIDNETEQELLKVFGK